MDRILREVKLALWFGVFGPLIARPLLPPDSLDLVIGMPIYFLFLIYVLDRLDGALHAADYWKARHASLRRRRERYRKQFLDKIQRRKCTQN